MEKSLEEWHGAIGYITEAMLSKYIDDLALPIYYVDGPAAMVNAMRQVLADAGVDGDNIRTEEFAGYYSRRLRGDAAWPSTNASQVGLPVIAQTATA